jgi:hypothetical protein
MPLHDLQEVMEATETVILSGEIYLSGGAAGSSSVDGQPVGFFKMISAPSGE